MALADSWVALLGRRDSFRAPSVTVGLRRRGTLIEKALGFVLWRPASTAAKVRARTLEHLEWQLPAEGVVVSGELFERVDEMLPLGSNVNRGGERDTERDSERRREIEREQRLQGKARRR
jgi:hypothetical protein